MSRNPSNMRRLYQAFPIRETASLELNNLRYINIFFLCLPIWGAVRSELQEAQE